MKNLTLFISAFCLFTACASSKPVDLPESSNSENEEVKTPILVSPDGYRFMISESSDDPNYGYSKKKPIKVGGNDLNEGPINERRFLNALAGPNGEEITYTRQGSCCQFKTPNGIMGAGFLDIYIVSWEGAKETKTLYINMYDYGELKAPVGFTILETR